MIDFIDLQMLPSWSLLAAGYVAVVNIAGFVIMGIDKKRAVRGAWRISEATLFFTALIGGSLGCILGMQYFRHKTRHWYFRYGMPAILTIQVLAWLFFHKTSLL